MVKTFHQEFNFQGVELWPEQQEELKQQVEEALRTGKPIQHVQINATGGKRKLGCSSVLLIAVSASLSAICVSRLLLLL